MVELRWGATTDAGRVRTENEDTFVAEPMVFAVADGMGGHQAGEVASALAASIMRDRLGGGAASEDAAAAAVGEANAAIYGAAKANPAQSGMGTTLTAIAVLTEDNPEGDERLVLLNVGDSRTYRFRGGRLQRVTVDHSYVQELVAAGHISIEEARTHPRRNIVTRALGIEPMVRADLWTLPIVRGDRYILASDGLVDEVPDHEILDLVAAIADPQELSKQLVDIANRHGGRDNVTVVVVDVIEGADPPDPTDELAFDPNWAEGIQEPTVWADDLDLPPDAESTDDVLTAAEADGAAEITQRDVSAMPTEPPAALPLSSPPPPPNDAELAPLPSTSQPSTSQRSTSQPDNAHDEMVGGGPAVGPASALAAAPLHPTLPSLPNAGVMRISESAMLTAGPSTGGSTTGGSTAGTTTAGTTNGAKPKRKRFTFGVFLFTVLVAAVLAGTFTLIAVHARSGYFVAFDDDTVAIYKGQRDNVLWFEPTVNSRSTKTRADLSPEVIAAVEARATFDSFDEAANFIESNVATTVPETTTTTSPTTSTVPDTTPEESTTTTAPTGG